MCVRNFFVNDEVKKKVFLKMNDKEFIYIFLEYLATRVQAKSLCVVCNKVISNITVNYNAAWGLHKRVN